MNNVNRCNNGHLFNQQRGHRRGPSSYHMHDADVVFEQLNIKKGDSFLDLGCGAGDYSIQAAKMVGESGVVYALDIWEEVLDGLSDRAVTNGYKNIKTKVSDIKDKISVDDNSIDICFIATVLHSLNLIEDAERMFGEIQRILKSDGRMVIIECKKTNASFGPPLNCRISPEELDQIVKPYGFEKNSYVDLGYNYMISFSNNK